MLVFCELILTKPVPNIFIMYLGSVFMGMGVLDLPIELNNIDYKTLKTYNEFLYNNN